MSIREETSRPNWDFEGAPAIASFEWDRAEYVRDKLKAEAMEPVVSPCGDGSIHIRVGETRVEMRGEEIYYTRPGEHGALFDAYEVVRLFKESSL